MGAELRVGRDGAVATIALARTAARNVLTTDMLQGIADALDALSGDGRLRVVVLRGEGDAPFSAGYDMSTLPAGTVTEAEARAIHAPVRAAAAAIERCAHPVVGAARGYVFGAALDLFLHCDLRVCSDDTRFCMPPNRHGFLYPWEGVRRLAAVAGLACAQRMLLTGAAVPAAEALAAGIVQQSVDGARFEEALQALCDQLAGSAPMSTRETRRMLHGLARGEPPPDDRELYARITRCLNSEDVREAMVAFRERRPPRFAGR